MSPDTNPWQDIFVTENPLLIRSDGLIGISSALAAARGGGVYSNLASLQRVRLVIRQRKARSFHWFAENDGLSPDSFSTRSTRPRGRFARYSVTGLNGEGNVTAAAIAGSLVTPSLNPGEFRAYRGRIKGKNRKGRGTVILTSGSVADPQVSDSGSVSIKFKAKKKR
ncbi:MAG: hypothetical protein P1U87_05335 [Verrucomicrobiales bacterium]|nr:hypothetical protein [Verrucomicrobiales bacterium]